MKTQLKLVRLHQTGVNEEQLINMKTEVVNKVENILSAFENQTDTNKISLTVEICMCGLETEKEEFRMLTDNQWKELHSEVMNEVIN